VAPHFEFLKAVDTDRPDVKIENHGLSQYGAEPHYSTLPFCNFVH